MNLSGSTAQKATKLDRSKNTDVFLTGRWLAFIRPACIAIIAFALALWIAAIPVRYAQLATVCSTVCGDQQPDRHSMAQFKASGLTLEFYSAYIGTVEVLFVLVFVVLTAVILWKKSNTRMGLITALFLATFSVTNTATNALVASYPILSLPVALLQLIGWICLGLFLLIFPTGRFSPRWTRIMALAGIVALILSNTPIFPSVLFLPFLLAFVLLALVTQVYRYRYVFTSVQRQQTKWVVFGVAAAIAGVISLSSLVNLFPLSQSPGDFSFLFWDTLWYLFELLIPLSIGFAIVRTKLWDIDVVINRALVYGSLTLILALVYFGLVIGLQFLLGAMTGDKAQSPLIIVGSTLLIAALFQPLRHRIQRMIDRRFYRRKYDAARTLATFSATLRNEVDLNQLTEQLIEMVEETMQPAHVSLWLRSPLARTRFGEEGDSEDALPLGTYREHPGVV